MVAKNFYHLGTRIFAQLNIFRMIHNIIGRSLAILAVATAGTAQAQEIYRVEDNTAAVQLRTNTVYDLVLCPNIGMEIQTDLGLAWQLDYVGTWINNHSRNRYFSNYGLQTELRYYFGSQKHLMPYRGFHIGGYFQMATYDFEFGGTGYQCSDLGKTMGGGLSGGYALRLNRNLSLDFTAGFGYLTSRYTAYEPYAGWYRPTHYRKLTWIGPTKLEVSLVWNINKKNNQ